MENWIAAAAAGVLAILGASTTGDHKPPKNFNGQPSTTRERKMENVNMQCVAAAVAAREAALLTGQQTLTSAINSAYSARGMALASAYAQADQTAVKNAVKAAWKQFSDATKGSRSAWKKSKDSAWQTFKTAIKSCGSGAASVADTANAGSELNL